MKVNNFTEQYDMDGNGEINRADLDLMVQDPHTDFGFFEKMQRGGIEVTAQDLKDFKENGGQITALDLVHYVRKGGKLTGDDVMDLAQAGVPMEGKDLTHLVRLDVQLTTGDLERFIGPEIRGQITAKDTRYFERQGIAVPHQNTVPENATWDDIMGMMDAGIEINAVDIFVWMGKNPEAQGFGAYRIAEDIGPWENRGELVRNLCEKGAKISNTDLFALQERFHCFSGKELADMAEGRDIDLTAADLRNLCNDYQCVISNDDLGRILRACDIDITRSDYMDIIH